MGPPPPYYSAINTAMHSAFSVPVYKVGITLVSSSFYSIFFAFFVLSTLILNRQCKKSAGSQMSSTNVYLASSYLMFIVLTTIWVISTIMCFNPDSILLPPGPLGYTYTPLMFAQHIIGYFASFIGDFVMIYRLYIIWDQKKIIIWITSVLGIISLGLTIKVVVSFAQSLLILATLNMTLAGISISVNIITTGLLARTVWKRSSLTRAVGGEEVIYKLIAIIVESSALYTFWMLSFLISHFANINASQIFLYGTPHVAGIASMLINVRVGLGWAMGEEGRSVRSFHDSILVDDRPNRDSVNF